MTTTITITIALGAFVAFALGGWLFWLIEFRAHRLEATRHERAKLENSALNRLLGEYDSAARTEEALSRHAATTARLLAMRGGMWDGREGREN